LENFLDKNKNFEIYNKNNFKLSNNFLISIKKDLINIINLIDKNLKF